MSARPWSECSGRARQRNMRRCGHHAFVPRQSSLLWPPSNKSPICPGFQCEATSDLRNAGRVRGALACSAFARRCTLLMFDPVAARHHWPWTLRLHQQHAEKHGSSQSQNATSPVGCYVSLLPSEPNISIWCSNPAKGNVAGDAVICCMICQPHKHVQHFTARSRLDSYPQRCLLVQFKQVLGNKPINW